MNKFALLAALATAPFLAPAEAFAQSAPVSVKPVAPAAVMESVGVVPAKVTPSVVEKVKRQGKTLELNAFTEALENRLTVALSGTRKFKVVTRGDLDAVIKEQNLAASGNLDAADPQLAKAFKLAGVKSILLVTIDDFQDRDEEFKSEAMGQTFRRRTIRAGASAKLLDTTTGQVKESVAIPPVTQDDLRAILAKLTSSADRADAIAPELARLVSERVAQRLVDSRFPAKVMAKSPDGVVTFNRGDGSGVQVGQEWGVYAVGEELVDPDTGETLGAEEVLIGRAIVTDVEAKFAKARLLKDQGVARGAVLRPVAPAAQPAEEASAPKPAPEEKPAPAAPAAKPAVAEAAPIKLTMDAEGVLRVDGNIIKPKEAPEVFQRMKLANPGAKVVFSADRATKMSSVQKALEAIKSAGFADVKVETSGDESAKAPAAGSTPEV